MPRRSKLVRREFKDGAAGIRWLAETNEDNFCYKAAAKLYREIGDEEAAKRCEAGAKRMGQTP